MSMRFNRRQFLEYSAVAGAANYLLSADAEAQDAAARIKPTKDKLNLGVIGIAHRGGDNLNEVASQNIVALCDVDDSYLAAGTQKFPQAKTYNDFRKLIEQKGLDAVVISTADHTHAVATTMAIKAGLHVYCEKPLTHSVHEARVVAETARRYKRVTQMGTQIHAGSNYRRVVELIKSGAIGSVREVHVWCDKVWSAAGPRPTHTPDAPANLHWDLWLGPAPYRPYHPTYAPANWRGWWDFGGGTLGDMACHHMDLSHWALDLWHPATVEAEGPPVKAETTPEWLVVRYLYPARAERAPVNLTWYQGGKRPPQFAEGKLPQWGDGTLFVGSRGMLLADYGRYALLPEKQFVDFKPPAPFIPNSIGHHLEWIEACKTGSITTCNFSYSGALTEAVLLGNVAYRAGCKLQWDAARLKATNCPHAGQFLRREYRKGWQL